MQTVSKNGFLLSLVLGALHFITSYTNKILAFVCPTLCQAGMKHKNFSKIVTKYVFHYGRMVGLHPFITQLHALVTLSPVPIQ